MKFICKDSKTYYAAVYRGFGIRMWIGQAFWNAPMTGTDSKGGTIIHEMSHEVGWTNDYKYGTTDALELAKNKPRRAVRNADNYEYFVEVR